MKAIYYNIFGLGHINPTLPLVCALRKAGVEIIYHTSPNRKELIESTGARFKNYGYDDYQASDFNPNKNFVLQTIPAALGLLPFLRAEFERVKPDFIIYDSMAIWGYVIAEIYKIPSFCTVVTMALPIEAKRETFRQHKVEMDDVNLRALEILKSTHGVELSLHQSLGAYGKNNIIFTAKKLNPRMSEMNADQFFYSGAMIKRKEDLSDFPLRFPLEQIKLKGKKIITMAVGTILLEEDPTVLNWYKALIEAFAEDQNYYLVLSVGDEKNREVLGNIPSNAFLFSRIPQLEVLKHTDFFINHAGMNSLNEALFYGVPMLVIPHSKDQFVNAKRLVDLKLGVQLTKDNVTKESIREKILELSTNQELQINLENMRDHFQAHEGLEGIMSYIMERVL